MTTFTPADAERFHAALVEIHKLAERDDDPETLLDIQEVAATALSVTPTPETRADLTARQAEILGYIRDYRVAAGYSPSIREVCQRFGINSPNGVACHLKALKRKGYLAYTEYTARSFTPLEAAR